MADDEMNSSWVDRWLQILEQQLGPPRRKELFEPGPDFYAKLESGDDEDLRASALELAAYLGLITAPRVSYELTLVMGTEGAARIHGAGTQESRVEIGLDYVGRPHILGALLAHELAHEKLGLSRIGMSDEEENERLTDLAAMALGLGKLMLNGVVTQHAPGSGEIRVSGYLSPEMQAYAYQEVGRRRHLSKTETQSGLTAEAIGRLDSAS